MTITASNYFEQVDTFISKLPAAVKEAHDLVTSLKNDGIENPFDTGDKDIDEVGSKLLEQANKVLKDSATPAAPKAAKKSVKSVKSVAPKKATAKKPTQINTDSTEKKKTVRKTVRKKSEKSVKSVAKKSASKKSMPVKKAKRMAQKVATKAVKQARKADAKKAPVTVKKLSLELQLIKQVVGMAGKTYTIDALRKKALTIKNHMAEGRIHDHVNIIKQLLTAFNKLIDTAVEMKADKVKVTISKGKQTELSALVKNATVRVRTEFLAGADDARILEMVKHFKKHHWASSNVDNDDTAFFEQINISPMEIGTSSSTGMDIKYYDVEKVIPKHGGFVKIESAVSGVKNSFKKSVQSVAKKNTRKKVQRKSVKSVAKKRTTKKA